MAVLKAKTDAAEARLAGLDLPAGAAWAREVRAAARARLLAGGLPARRDEYWRYSDPTRLAAAPRAALPADEPDAFAAVDAIRLVFTDGVFDATLSDAAAVEGLEIATLAEATAADLTWARGLFGQLEAQGQSPVERPYAALNTALATEGLAIRARGQIARPVLIHCRRTGAAGEALLHHLVKLDAGASLTLIETGSAAARGVTCIEADLAEGATLDHLRLQPRDPEAEVLAHVFARLGAAARFRSFVGTAESRFTRTETVVTLAGAEGLAHVGGAYLGLGAGHRDDTVFITHEGRGCESRQVFNDVLSGGAVGVFQGKILVRQPAQKTDGYQISQSLLLDDASQFLAKPELEIYADDVKCSHGSTSGAIDETALFYLRSRGVPKPRAEDLLILSFLAEAVDEIADPDLRAAVLERLTHWLETRGA